MKLRNKKTGMIVEVDHFDYSDDTIILVNIDDQVKWHEYASLAKLNEDWEDYEEPKEYWYMENNGEIYKDTYDGDGYEEEMQQICNYFETKEEAEKAVEKLKAWKRLKDKGFRFDNFIGDAIYYAIGDEEIKKDAVREDLDLLFGGEE